MLCVIKCMCMRISQFPTDGNEEEKVRKGKGGSKEKTKREGTNKQEVEEVKRIKDNVGSKKEAGR